MVGAFPYVPYFDAKSTAEEEEGEVDSRVRSGGSVHNKPLTNSLDHFRGFKVQILLDFFQIIGSSLFASFSDHQKPKSPQG